MSTKTAENLSLRWAQGEVFNAKNRFRVLVAGRRFGKSYLSCIELLKAAIDRPGETYFYCAPTYRMAKDIAWKEIKKLIPPQWIASKNETDLKIELINGSLIELKGTENATTLRGRSLAGVVLDEASDQPSQINKAGHSSYLHQTAQPHGSMIYGATFQKIHREIGNAGALQQ